MKRGNKVLQFAHRVAGGRAIYICYAAASLNLRKLTMEGGLNLRKYIYVGGRLKPPEVEVPPGPYIPPVELGINVYAPSLVFTTHKGWLVCTTRTDVPPRLRSVSVPTDIPRGGSRHQSPDRGPLSSAAPGPAQLIS